MIKTLQRRFALSRQGAVDLIKGCIACVLQDISFMLPVGLLYNFVIDITLNFINGTIVVFIDCCIYVLEFVIGRNIILMIILSPK